MSHKRVLAGVLLVALLALAGCSSVLGPEPVDHAALRENETYDWQTGVNASITITGSEYEAVYNMSDTSKFVVYSRDGLGREHPLSISALKFRYPNGTVVNASSPALNATNNEHETVIFLPAKNGKLAFSAPAPGKRFATRTFVTGSYEVTIPKNMRVEYVPLARVSPPGYETRRTETGQVLIHWDDVQSDAVIVRYYLARDIYIFAAGAAVLVLIALGGTLYYLRQIRELERRRRDAGPDVDTGDDDGPGL
ncbi:MAG TPA: DUF5803 family protein [Halococcus sp.]|nr:DUF5803 family protein [Halococcus sp.]